jgi:oligopeptide/dipeptide ABC transporter ATP-binding protein
MSKLLEVKDLKMYIKVRRGVVKAVDGISFSVDAGEAFGIVGESGCGKTMTSLSLLKLQPHPAGQIIGGEIILDGEDLVQKNEAEMRKVRGRKLSMILQDPLTSLNPAYSIGNQVAEAVIIHQHLKGKPLWEKVIQALRLVKIPAAERRLRDFPHQMSGGMRQRVTGAIALSTEPLLLIADEPTTSLDVTIQAQYMELLKEIQVKSKVGMIFITHDFGIIAEMCENVAVMYAGRIVEKASTRDLFNNPLHPYTKALIGCLPKLEARWQKLDTIPGQPPDLSKLPVGCRFADRCPEVMDVCTQGYPEETVVEGNHNVSCWLQEKQS